MASRSLFVCRRCDYQAGKWLGRCPECGAWGSLEEVESVPDGVRPRGSPAAPAVPFPEIEMTDGGRLPTGIGELDRVLGGGLVRGAVVLIGGEPGIGKSTLLLQAASRLAEAGGTVLYATGEESAAQLRSRGDRLGVRSKHLLVAAETSVDALLSTSRAVSPAMLVVDSIQAVRCPDLDGVAGTTGQVREAAARFVSYAKTTATPVLLVGHVTKEGSIAGPRVLEHAVDTVVQFEGDRHHEHRILRALKNRFGPANELGVFKMTEAGLSEVADPSELLLAERPAGHPGSVVLAAVEGSRPLLVEVQALVGEPAQGTPRRTALGVDASRLAMILAVLERAVGLALAQRDVFVNVTGGLSIVEPASDLAVAAALASSARRRAIPPRSVVFGEIGLTGEVRAVSHLAARLREAARLGFDAAVGPGKSAGLGGLRLLAAQSVEGAFDHLFGAGDRADLSTREGSHA